VEEADPELDGDAVVPTFLTIMAANMAVVLASHPSKGRPARKGEVENTVFAMGERGLRINSAEYLKATQQAHKLGRQMAAFHATYDVLLTPGLSGLPPKLGWVDMMLEDVDEYWRRVFQMSPFTVPFNLTGQPGLMLPLSQSEDGYPIAVQLVARYGDEATLFRLGAQLETARPWFGRKPEIARIT
jgi:Asp-tRNA(Asn)/Glu-tRNA(Gln) amidotransferase A subunit family amidase